MRTLAAVQAVAVTPPAFEDVYAEHFDYVYRVVARLAGRATAEDLTQEVFLVVHRRLAGFEGRAKLTTWLFQIAWNVVGSHQRRERVRRGLMAVFGRAPEPVLAPCPLERAEEAARLARALAALPWPQRAALLLCEVEGWSAALLAERLDVPVNTIYTRLHHARRRLAELLGQAEEAT